MKEEQVEVLKRLRKVTGNKILVCRCHVEDIKREDGRTLIAMPDGWRDGAMGMVEFDQISFMCSLEKPFVELVDVGDDCHAFPLKDARRGRSGAFGETLICRCPSHHSAKHVGGPYWVVEPDAVFPAYWRDGGIVPLRDMVVIKIERQDRKDTCAIIDPSYYEHISNRGVVIDKGPKCGWNYAIDDRVVVEKPFKCFGMGGNWYTVLHESKVLCVIEQSPLRF